MIILIIKLKQTLSIDVLSQEEQLQGKLGLLDDNANDLDKILVCGFVNFPFCT